MDGWEPERTTVYHYDDTGQLTHTTTSVEPEWDAAALTLVAEWRAYQAELHVCGRHLSESKRRGDGTDLDFIAGFDRCLACEALEEAQRKQALKDTDTSPRAGRLWRVYTREEALALTR